MAFNLKQKLAEGKDATVKAFTKAADKVETKLHAVEKKVGEKLHSLRPKKDEPKNEGPKNV